MAKREKLSAQIREGAGKGVARRTRREGSVPAVLYGRSIAPVSLSVNAKEAQRVISHAGTHAILDLQTDGDKDASGTVLIKEVQRDARRGDLLHLDFQRIAMDEEIVSVIPIRLAGEPVGVKVGGVLQHGVYEMTVKGIARDIPEYVDADISDLDIGMNLRVAEIVLPEGLIPVTMGEEVVASVIMPRGKGLTPEEEEAAAAAAEEEAAEPEVIGRAGAEGEREGAE